MTGDPMTRTCIVFFTVLAISCALVTAGCVSHQFVEKNSTEITVSPSTISADLDQQNDWAYQYRNNLTPAQKKIPAELLPIIDPNYPKEHIHITKKDLAAGQFFIPAEKASQKFNISEYQAQEDGGEIYVHIDLQPTASLDVIDPYATDIPIKNEEWDFVGGWVGLNNLEKIASLPDVKEIKLPSPAVTY
ncbi:MAG: hypothetical protein WC379_12655 [Methanoregula sp.]|jgi:outer membrane murein-binding lipoprotein Lpp